MNRERTDCENFQRRDFLHVGALSLMGLSLPNLLAGESLAKSIGTPWSARPPKPARNIIMIWLAGGPSTIDMWDLKPDALSSIRGEFATIPTSADGVQICEHLPKIAEQMRDCTIVRSVRHTIAEHGQGTEYVMTGNPISPSLTYPSIGSVVSKSTSGERGVPVYMDLTGSDYGKAGYLGSAHNPFVVEGMGRRSSNVDSQFGLPDGFTVHDLGRKNELLQKLEQGFRRFDKTARADEMTEFQQQAVDILITGKTKAALDIRKEDSEVAQRYGFATLGRSALAARRLIQAGVRFVTIGFSGWDTHSNNFGQLRNTLLPQLDSAVAALIQDLRDHDLLGETIIYCVGEFNRTPIINAQGGRDHWARSMSVLLAGGGLKRGFVYGSTDKNGFEPDSSPCTPTDINATILNQLGISPETTLNTKSGRPVQVFRDGKVLAELVE